MNTGGQQTRTRQRDAELKSGSFEPLSDAVSQTERSLN